MYIEDGGGLGGITCFPPRPPSQLTPFRNLHLKGGFSAINIYVYISISSSFSFPAQEHVVGDDVVDVRVRVNFGVRVRVIGARSFVGLPGLLVLVFAIGPVQQLCRI